ncbi:MAG: SDR family oxidoreductase [Chloroflexi bacterium]|nr:SDR family oxidoreductase [Chloroflexota bacterium]
MKETTGFREKVVIITGASSGIGKAVSLQLASEGACVSLAARNAERLQEIAQECNQLGGSAIAIPTDIADQQQCRNLITKTVEKFGRIDMLVNNAGFTVVDKFEDLQTLELFQRVMNVNFNGAVQCTYFALPHLKNTHGRIVNISSLGGIVPFPGNASYAASKAAMTGFSDYLRLELQDDQVSVTMIYPGAVVTKFQEHRLDKDGQVRGSDGGSLYTEDMMTADECAEIIIEAAKQRKREVVMKPGKISRWIKLISPSLLDKIIIERVKKIIEREAQESK